MMATFTLMNCYIAACAANSDEPLIVRHSFGQQLDLARSMFRSLARQGAAQGYKVVGSMELLGDPVSLVGNMGTGVYQFFRKTGADLLGVPALPPEARVIAEMAPRLTGAGLPLGHARAAAGAVAFSAV